MFLFIIFILSGVAIVVLLFAKTWQIKSHKPVRMLKMVSLADKHIRTFAHEATHKYSLYKERSEFVIKKQVPLHAKNIANKTEIIIKEKLDKYIGDIRNTRFLSSKNKEGISEFFRNMEDFEAETAEAIKDMDEANKSSLDEEEKKG